MAVIATLATEVVAHTGNFMKGMKGAVASAAEFTAAIARTRDGMGTFDSALKKSREEAKAFEGDLKKIQASAGKAIGDIRKDMLGVSSMSGLPMTGGEAALLAREEKASIAHMSNRQVGGGDTGMYAAHVLTRSDVSRFDSASISLAGLTKSLIAVRAGFSAAQVAVAALNKDDEKLIETIKGFPIIGTMAYGIADAITGTSRTIADMNAYVQRSSEYFNQLEKDIQRTTKATEDHARAMNALMDELRVARMEPGERGPVQAEAATAQRIAEVRADFDAQRAAAKAARDEMVKPLREQQLALNEPRMDAVTVPGMNWQNRQLRRYREEKRSLDAEIRNAQRSYENETASLAARERERIEAINEVGRNTRSDALEKESRDRIAKEDKEREEARKHANELAAIHAENAAKNLKLQRDDLGAEIILIKAKYAERIGEAKQAGKQELAAALEIARDRDVALARLPDLKQSVAAKERSPRPYDPFGGNAALLSQSLTRQPGQGNSDVKALLKVNQEHRDISRKTVNRLERLIRAVEEERDVVFSIA